MELSKTDQNLPDYEKVPLEFHGHRKKLLFIWDCIETYRKKKNLSPSVISALEVGCSNGENLSLPLSACGYQILGIDLHSDSIDYANAHKRSENVNFSCMLLEELKDDLLFDIVILSDILEHVEDPKRLCLTAKKKLKPGGVVLISIPNGYGPYEMEQWLLKKTGVETMIEGLRSLINRFRRTPEQASYNLDSGHIQFFQLEKFESLLREVGFEIEKKQKGALLGGKLTVMSRKIFPSLIAWSLKAADHLPMRMVSTWYFCCTLKK